MKKTNYYKKRLGLMNKFQIASDLHIEYKSDKIPHPLTLITPSADNLILAGDIGSFYKYNQLKQFLTNLCTYFKIVLYIPGNHEYYRQVGYESLKMNVLFKKVLRIEESINNLYILNRSSVKIDDVCIVGCTLWSNPQISVPQFIVRIRGMTSFLYKKKFKADLEYINKMIQYCQNKNLKLLLVTHHVPSFSLLNYSGKKDKYSSLYATNLEYLLYKNKIHTWICGHIHNNFDLITSGGTHLVGNQKGKPKDKISDYNKKMVIEI